MATVKLLAKFQSKETIRNQFLDVIGVSYTEKEAEDWLFVGDVQMGKFDRQTNFDPPAIEMER